MSESYTPVPSTAEVHDKTQAVANQAAGAAQHAYGSAQQHPAPPHQGSHLKEDFEEFERELKATTDKATKDGKDDVTAATASYLEKALHIADAGLSTAQSYVGAGKEHLGGPHPGPGGHPPTGLAASFSATAASALDALSSGLGMAHTQLHANAPTSFQQSHPHPPSTAVTSPVKPIGQALSHNVSAVAGAAQPHVDAAKAAAQPHYEAAQAAVQPHVDAAKSAAQPHYEAAQAAAQPHVDAAKSAAQPHIDAAKDTYNAVQTSDKSYVQQAQDAAQPTIDAAKSTVNDIQTSDKSYTQQAKEAAQPHVDAAKAAYGQTTEDTTASNPSPSVDAAKPPAEYSAGGESATQV